ncbi:AAA domain-containing protein [Salmonella enterica subsp. enterica serovar Enteritidis]|nr:AAA domain-containing protein [Salmonella enterica subsp. enterica serovar Enteritidis]
MRLDRLTNKFQLALADAQSLALGHDNQFIEPLHLMSALLNQEGGSIRPLLTSAGINAGQLRTAIDQALSRLPQVEGTGGDVQPSSELVRVLNLCDKLAQKRGDNFISSELFVLAALESRGTLTDLLKSAGATTANITQAIEQMRGGESVNDQGAEDQRQALKKYTVDLTERAEQGKLDPVIGRDEEIRRTIQVLQRRTKNNPVLIGEPGVGKTAIVEGLARWTGIPVARMLEGEREKLLRMEQELHSRVIGQNEAVEAVSNAIRRSRAGLSDPNRPIGSFLFLGPTGVGKTELCKALANFMFDSDDAMVRIDMSEFMEKHSVSRLVGAPPGYVGYEEGGYLTEAVRRRPYSVILLDEVEKAHPDVFNILLQVLDDGRLTDGQGRTVDFRNTVVIMTSNLGSDLIQERFGELDYGRMKEMVLGVVSQNFRPEFINRIDEVVVFHPLGEQHIASIAQIQLQRLYKRLEERGYEIHISDEALKLLSANGYDPVYGARPLKRAIQQQIENPLAQQILSGELVPGKVIRLEASDDRIVAVQ